MSKPDWWETAESEINVSLPRLTQMLRDRIDEICETPLKVLVRKNPFLFRIRGVAHSDVLIESVLSAFLSSSEETIFGRMLETCALTIGKYGCGARKSSSEGIDLEWDEGGVRFLVQVKSGENWGNSSQKKQMKNHFEKARNVLGRNQPIECIEGISYGKSRDKDVKTLAGVVTHRKIVGRSFWHLLSQWDGAYATLMDLVGQHADNGLQEHRKRGHINITRYLEDKGIVKDGIIDWATYLRVVHK